MAAAWISDGSDVPSVPPRVAAGPWRSWRIGSYEFQRFPRADSGPGSRGRWGCCWRNQRGIGCYRTPLGALIALRRHMREYP